MDKPLTNTASRNFVKYCIAIQELKKALSTFIKEQSEELSNRHIKYIKRKCDVSAHTCRECYFRPSGENCASSNRCAQNGSCDELYQIITKSHVDRYPNWSNARWELLSSSPWQQIKCYISDRGYEEVSVIEEAVITAFVQICCNHRDLKHLVGKDICNLQKIVDTQNDVFKSEPVLLKDEDLHQHMKNIKAVLQIDCFSSTTDIQIHVSVIEKLLVDERPLVVEDEIIARHSVIAHLNRSIASLEHLQDEAEESGNDYTAKISDLYFIKKRHCKQLQTRFLEIESFIKELNQECKTHKEKLLKHKKEAAKLWFTADLQSSAVGAIGTLTDKATYKWYMQFLQEGTYDDVTKVLNGVDKNGISLKQMDRSINQVKDGVRHLNSTLCGMADLLLKVTTEGAQDNEALSDELVSAGNAVRNGDIPTVERERKFQHLLRDFFQNLEQGGNTIGRVSHGCMAIYISCPTVKNLLALCEDFFCGKLTAMVQPLQEYLRTLPGCQDLIVVVDIFEKDYLNCIMPIMNEVRHKLDTRLQQLISLTPDVQDNTLQNDPEDSTSLPDEHSNNQADGLTDNNTIELSTADFDISVPLLHQTDKVQVEDNDIDDDNESTVRFDRLLEHGATGFSMAPMSDDSEGDYLSKTKWRAEPLAELYVRARNENSAWRLALKADKLNMAGDECLSKVETFIQEGKALRSLVKGKRLEEPVLSDIFTWISNELFQDIELTPIALRHAIQKHILTGRKDITEVLIDIFTGFWQNENKLEELQNQVLDPQYDKANYVIYFYCLATFLDLDIYVVNSESNNGCKWNEYKSLKLLTIQQEINYRNRMFEFNVNRKEQPGFLMAYVHMDASGLHMYPIRSQSSQPQRPKCKGMVELAARYLRSTPLGAITVPTWLVVDVQQNAAQIPEKCKRISYWIEELCRETDCWHIYEREIEVPNLDSWSKHRVPRFDSTLRLKLIKHLSDASRDHVLTFCRILLRRCEFKVLEGLSDHFKSADIPFKHKYAVLRNFETELGKFNAAISIGTKPSELQERRGRVNNAVIGTSIFGLVGGVLGVVGLALIPVTFGLSLGLTVAGGVIGASSGIVQGGFRVHEAVKQNQLTAEIRETLEKVRGDFEKALTDFTKEFNLDVIGNSGPESPGLNIRGILSIGAILRSVHSGVGIGFAAARVGASAATAAAAVLTPVSLILDGGFMAEAIYGKATGNHTEAGRKRECLRVFQTIVNATYRGNADFNTNIVERIMQND